MAKKDNREFYGFTLTDRNTQPSIEGRFYNNSTIIPCIDEIYDEETESNRVIRYLPGERSIFVDEQDNKDLTKRVQITFNNGQLIVDKRQVTLLKFLRACNGNVTNPNRMKDSRKVFQEYIPGEGAKDLIAEDKEIIDAKQAVYNLGIDDLIAYARVLGVDVKRDPAEIRYHLSILAEDNPKQFMTGLRNPAVKREHYLHQAVDAGLIVVVRDENSVRWLSSKEIIVQAPAGIDPLTYMAEWTFDKGEKVYEHIRELLAPKKKSTIDVDIVDEEPKPDFVGMPTDELYDMCKEAGVIVMKAGGLANFKGRKIAQGKDKSVAFIDEKPGLKRELIKALEKAMEEA